VITDLEIALPNEALAALRELDCIEIRREETSPPDCWNSILSLSVRNKRGKGVGCHYIG
jgi:hypothetical protein